MSFLQTPYDKLTVNHIDGDTTNNSIENLEWVTIAENNRHGFQTGLFEATQKPVILESMDGEKLRFASMSEASRHLGRNPGYVSLAIARCNNCYDTSGKKYWASLDNGGDSS